MPFATALRNVPAPPDPTVQYVDDDRKPTRAFYDYLKELQRCLATQQAALRELEPP